MFIDPIQRVDSFWTQEAQALARFIDAAWLPKYDPHLGLESFEGKRVIGAAHRCKVVR